jgi:hypothetical protein
MRLGFNASRAAIAIILRLSSGVVRQHDRRFARSGSCRQPRNCPQLGI